MITIVSTLCPLGKDLVDVMPLGQDRVVVVPFQAGISAT
jgi:hypothetical protein